MILTVFLITCYDYKSSSSTRQFKNCDRISRFIVDEDDNGKLRLERVYMFNLLPFMLNLSSITMITRPRHIYLLFLNCK